jgi:hypothetical protein
MIRVGQTIIRALAIATMAVVAYFPSSAERWSNA